MIHILNAYPKEDESKDPGTEHDQEEYINRYIPWWVSPQVDWRIRSPNVVTARPANSPRLRHFNNLVFMCRDCWNFPMTCFLLSCICESRPLNVDSESVQNPIIILFNRAIKTRIGYNLLFGQSMSIESNWKRLLRSTWQNSRKVCDICSSWWMAMIWNGQFSSSVWSSRTLFNLDVFIFATWVIS